LLREAQEVVGSLPVVTGSSREESPVRAAKGICERDRNQEFLSGFLPLEASAVVLLFIPKSEHWRNIACAFHQVVL